MEAPTRRTRLPKHISDSTTQVGQDYVATGVLLALGTNNHLHKLENAAEQATHGEQCMPFFKNIAIYHGHKTRSSRAKPN
jgi:hypothetical protein